MSSFFVSSYFKNSLMSLLFAAVYGAYRMGRSMQVYFFTMLFS